MIARKILPLGKVQSEESPDSVGQRKG